MTSVDRLLADYIAEHRAAVRRTRASSSPAHPRETGRSSPR